MLFWVGFPSIESPTQKSYAVVLFFTLIRAEEAAKRRSPSPSLTGPDRPCRPMSATARLKVRFSSQRRVGVRTHLWRPSAPRDRDCDQDAPQRAGHG